jgi:hypothetical protein
MFSQHAAGVLVFLNLPNCFTQAGSFKSKLKAANPGK